MIKDLYATRIQSLFRGYFIRQHFWSLSIHPVEIERWDCVYNGTKHQLVRRDAPIDNFYCDFCAGDCVDFRYACLHGCDFDLCTNCYTRDPFPRRLGYYVKKY